MYVDHASATPIDSRVLDAMVPFFQDDFYNPGGIYAPATKVKDVINLARNTVADLLKVRGQNIYFIDGATEANNIALVGSVMAWRESHLGQIPHVVTCTIEHAAILEPLYDLAEKKLIDLTVLSVDQHGYVDIKELKASLSPQTMLVSIGYVNGEIGTIQDIKLIAKAIRHYRKHNNTEYPYFHTDAVQAMNYVDVIGVPQLGVDMMTLNAAKIYGPKKIAVLYVRPGIKLTPQIRGGNQESGLRSGTENVPYIIGMSESLKVTRMLQPTELIRMSQLCDYAHKVFSQLPGVVINSPINNVIPNIISLSFSNISHEEIVIRLDARGIYASVKSACKAGEDGDSHVILAIRESQEKDLPTGSLRLSFGRSTSKKDITRIYEVLSRVLNDMNDTYKLYVAE